MLETRARQPRCTKMLKTGLKCDGIAFRGAGYCYNHDPSPEGKAKRALRNAHFSAAMKLRWWERRQERVRLLNPAASTLGYAPMNQARPRATPRRVPVEM